MLSHKKYNQIALIAAEYARDEESLQKFLSAIKEVLNYSEDQSTYSRTAYERQKEKRKATGDTSKGDYLKKYYETHKKELNERRLQYYHKKRQEQVRSEA